jgi:hypothetical protein
METDVKHTSHPRASFAGASMAVTVVLAFALAGCGGGSDTPVAAGSTDAVDDPIIGGGSEFCDIAEESLAAEGAVNQASDDLQAAMTSGDIDALHAASQAVLDNSVLATRFYTLGEAAADDQATKDAFSGLAQFVEEYSVAMGQAGVDAETVPEFTAAITTLFTNPELQPLLQSTTGWATTTHDFTVAECGIAG